MRFDESRERPQLQYEPIGTGGKTRLIAVGADTGAIIDIDTIDVARAPDRAAYARRIALMFPRGAAPEVERELLKIAEERLGLNRRAAEPALTLADALDEWQATDDVPQIATGFWPLDELAGGGLPHGSLTVIAGQPGCGKSALALQAILGSLFLDLELRAVWGLGEMTREALARRAVAVGSVLMGGRGPVTLNAAGRRDRPAIVVADDLRQTVAGRLHIAAPLTLDRIEAAVTGTGAKLLVVDFLQLVRVDEAVDRRQEVDAVVKGLREMSLTYGIAIIAVSNIARSVGRDSRAGSIGKESSEIDFAADVVLLGDPDEHEGEHGLRTVRWACKKNRHGRPSDIEATFDGSLQVFTAGAAEPFPEFLPPNEIPPPEMRRIDVSSAEFRRDHQKGSGA